MERVPVISKDNQPLMPTKPSRARRWISEGKAVGKFNDLGQFYVQLIVEPSDTKTQPISIGIDPGKLYSGMGVQSSKATLATFHLELPFKRVRERMDNRRLIRRARRGRRINRQVPFNLRAHRQKRFSNRRQGKLAPFIRANRQLELRVISELVKVFPVTDIYFEYIKADVDLTSGRKGAKSGKGFSTVMVGQKFMLEQLKQYAQVHTKFGWETSNLRKHLELPKSKDKSEQTPSSHAVDGVALASYRFLKYKHFVSREGEGYQWKGNVTITNAPFTVIRRPPISRRQLHLMLPSKGGVRRKYGGSTTRFGVRKGDLVRAGKAGKTYTGWVSGDTATQISVSNADWKRIGQFTAKKVELIRRSTGLIINPYYGGRAFLPPTKMSTTSQNETIWLNLRIFPLDKTSGASGKSIFGIGGINHKVSLKELQENIQQIDFSYEEDGIWLSVRAQDSIGNYDYTLHTTETALKRFMEELKPYKESLFIQNFIVAIQNQTLSVTKKQERPC